jgi:cyclopropane-fatty-acyl-phospholipid synthase
MKSKDKAAELLAKADVTINGQAPTDMQVHDERLYDRVFSSGSHWPWARLHGRLVGCRGPSGFFAKVLRSHLEKGHDPELFLACPARKAI